MKKALILILPIMALTLVGCKDNTPVQDDFVRTPMVAEELSECPVPTLNGGYNIVWDEEFNYNGLPDGSKWGYDLGTGNGGWGNQEAEYYTNREKNAFVQDGELHIKAYKENYNNSEYTSARLLTRNLGDWLYGKVEVRAKLPEGVGTWPAIWLMPTDSAYGGWPRSGEIDIMEAMGRKPNQMLSTVHMEAYYGGNGRGRTIGLANTSTEFHVYSMEWTPDYIKLYADDTLVTTYMNPKYSTDNKRYWPFDKRFYLILNVAMGGTLGGSIDPNFESAEMAVDYVRVYQNDYTGSDTEKPSLVELTDWNSGSNSINFTWDKATDNVGISHYEIVLDGKQVGATNTNSYRLAGLEPDKTYQLRIISVDLAGNYSITGNIQVQTVGIQNAPGTIQTEYSSDLKNGWLVNSPGGKAINLRNINSQNGYLVLEFMVSEAGTYHISINASVARSSNQLYVYTVNDVGEGDNGTPVNLSPTWGSFQDISLPGEYTFTTGKNNLKIESFSNSEGDIITIDYIEVND